MPVKPLGWTCPGRSGAGPSLFGQPVFGDGIRMASVGGARATRTTPVTEKSFEGTTGRAIEGDPESPALALRRTRRTHNTQIHEVPCLILGADMALQVLPVEVNRRAKAG